MDDSQLTHIDEQDMPGPGAARTGAAARRGPGEEQMSRQEWKTVSLAKPLYAEIQEHRVPNHSKSVQAYVHHWVRIGLMVDAAMDSVDDKTSLAERLLELLSQPSNSPAE